MLGIIAALPVFVSFPIINVLVKSQGLGVVVWMAVGWQVLTSVALNLSSGKPSLG